MAESSSPASVDDPGPSGTLQAPGNTPEPAGKNSLTVLIAFGANVLIAIAKTIAALITGSASMVAEAAHSWADSGNEIFLLIADRKGRRGRDRTHPLGYGRDTYVWSMFAAFGLFTAGAVVSVMHGVQELLSPEPASEYLIGYIVLAVAFVLEGISFIQARRQAKRLSRAYQQRMIEFILTTCNTTLRAVFFEDFAALLGLIFAATGIGLHQLTGSPIPDAIGSIMVGVLLALVALILIDRNRRFLVGGETVDTQTRQRILELLLTHPDVARITYLHIEFVGPGRLFLVAAIDMAGNAQEDDVAVKLRRLERQIEEHERIEEAVLTLATADEPSLSASGHQVNTRS